VIGTTGSLGASSSHKDALSDRSRSICRALRCLAPRDAGDGPRLRKRERD
jgi:hypothetical protein